MAVLKTAETTCRDGSVQARHVIQSNPIPTSFFNTILRVVLQDYWEEQSLKQKKRCRDGVTCVVFVYLLVQIVLVSDYSGSVKELQ